MPKNSRRRTRRIALLACGFLLVLFGSPAVAASAPQLAGALQVNAHSGKCMEVYDSQTVNGAIVVQWDCHGGPNQRWTPRCHPSYPCGYFYMLVNDRSGKCLEVAGGSTANQARIQQWDCHGGAWQVWQPTLSSSGNEPLLYWNENSQKVLEVYGASRGNGASIVQWDSNGLNHQYWYRR